MTNVVRDLKRKNINTHTHTQDINMSSCFPKQFTGNNLTCIFFNFILFFKLYIIVLVLPNIKMNLPQVYMCSPS